MNQRWRRLPQGDWTQRPGPQTAAGAHHQSGPSPHRGRSRARLRPRQLAPWLVLLAGFAGCGGRAEQAYPGDDPANIQSGGSENPRGVPSDLEPEQGPPATDSTPSVPLQGCRGGWQPGSAPTCPWLANGECYATREDACACTCPRTEHSLCVSGFPSGSNAQVWVACE